MRLFQPAAAIMLVLALPGCETADDKTHAAFRARLKTPAPLSQEELSMLVVETIRSIGSRRLRVLELGGVRELDPVIRSEVLSVLTSGISIEDTGARVEQGRAWRGLSGPGTPPRSELDATRTLWIDVDTLRPVRYELTYSLPGYGDYTYDLSVE